MTKIFEELQYIEERDKIIQNLKEFHKCQGNDFRHFVTSFVKDLVETIKFIQNGPFQFVSFPNPVRKAIVSKGTSQCVILFLPYPLEHKNDKNLVEKIHLVSIMPTMSEKY